MDREKFMQEQFIEGHEQTERALREQFKKLCEMEVTMLRGMSEMSEKISTLEPPKTGTTNRKIPLA
jgi:hypothetical protein